MLFWIPISFDYKLKQYKNVLSLIDPIELGGNDVVSVNVCVWGVEEVKIKDGPVYLKFYI